MEPRIRHEFVAIDEGLGTLLHVDERDGMRDWIVALGRPQPRDLQLVGDGRVLVGHHHGYAEFDVATGARLKEVDAFTGTTSVRRLPDGRTRIAGVNLLGETGLVIADLDHANRPIARRVLDGDYVRLVRETDAGTFLLMCNTRVREVDAAGSTLREFAAAGFYHAWKAVRLPNGHTLASAGYGAFMVEFDPDGAVVRTFGRKDRVPERIRPFFYAMFQLLPDGDVVVANWQDHGPGHGASGVQLLEFDPAGAIAWEWSDASRISSLQGVIVLDGLDLDLVHDERSGVMAPLTTPPAEESRETARIRRLEP